MRHLGEVFARLVRRAARLAETRRGAVVVFLAALAVWWLQALVIPLAQGRDLGTYLGAYAQLFQAHPIDLGYVLDRTPVATLIVGGLLDVAHGALAEPVTSLLYAGSVLAWFLAARVFGGGAALLTAIVLLAYPGYGILFHELSSDAVFAAAFAGWSLLAVRTLRAPSLRGFTLLGAGMGVLALVRPGNQALLVLALVPLAARIPWRARALSAVAFLVPAVVLLAGWTIQNGVRYGDYTFARGGNATVPFYRAFVTDRIVRPSNGPASRELARAVERDLLPQEPYRSYHITLAEFFREASPRMQTDLVALSDRLKGFDTNDAWLRTVGVEAVRTHPATYAHGVASSVWGMLTQGLYRTPSAPPGAIASQGRPSATASTGGASGPTVVVDGKRLPKPTEGEPIPAPHEGGVATPDHSIYTVWTSPYAHHLVFVHPGAEARYVALHERMTRLASHLPHRQGSTGLADRLNQLSRWFPPPVLWLALGLAGLVLRRPRDALALSVPTLAGLVVVLVSALGLPPEPHYSVPVAPAIVLLAAGGILGTSRRGEAVAAWGVPTPFAWLVARTAAGVAAGVWAVWLYGSKIHAHVGAPQASNDLAVFLHGASKVIHGTSPYAFHADKTYAYPPLLAVLAAPLHPLSPGAASIVWLLLSLAAIALSLRLLGVRDWRCYPVVAVYPFTRSAVDLGTVGPLLLLAVAAAWHWRDRVVRPALAVGAGIAVKLFLWPLVVWLALTGRIRNALLGVAFAVALALVPWAAIGFAGLGGYAGLLHRLSHREATSSYSVVALGVRAHVPEVAAVVVSLLVAAALLGAAAWIARDEGRSLRERDVAVLTLALATALAASPIVWVHYFLLLVVPLALTRPRLSPLWAVPFAYAPLGESAWPAGDARKLAIALAATLVLLGAVFVRRGGAAERGLPHRPRHPWWRRERRLETALLEAPERAQATQPR
jgi:glycosyl transferase family 87